MQQYPLYRLDGGQVVVQETQGGRWASLDGATANALLAVFDGMTLDALRNTVLRETAGAEPMRRVA
ncbi:hypothetical protein ABUE31_05250 [Mesorhizobium sp. ZMM04-5]|uniref:Uncharacterized protein n=1 Tax=Mesorhizobium marinum TaxID=3228790 RepID=A0ABV3QWE5_9HYPH